MHLVDSAWERDDYHAVAIHAQRVLDNKDVDNDLAYYERAVVESRLLSALLRNKEFERAQQLAEAHRQKENESFMLAVVSAAKGDLAEAGSIALEVARSDEGTYSIYNNDDVGAVFLTEAFCDLHEEDPADLPDFAEPTLAVFLFDQPLQLQADDISAALTRLGVKTTAVAQPLSTADAKVTSAFVLQFDSASVWLATGSGKYSDEWTLPERDPGLTVAYDASQGWLAVGSAAWTESLRKQVDALARRLASELVGNRPTIVCVRGKQAWAPFTAYAVNQNLVFAWQLTGDLKPFKDSGVPLDEKFYDGKIVSNRQFAHSLRGAVREFEDTPGARLKVMACLSDNPATDVLTFQVNKVDRSYGSYNFHGTLERQSLLVPQMIGGLRLNVGERKVVAWQLNDDTPVHRP
jgi:hypothetical protein